MSSRLGPSADTGVLAGSLAVGCLLVAACGGGEPTAPGGSDGDGDGGAGASVASVEVSPAADTLTAVGSTLELSARALDASGNELTGVEFTWSSSDEAVVTVDDSGVAEAVAGGEAEVTATVDGVSGSAALAVEQEVAAVAVSPSSATLTAVGDTQRFTATAEDANGHEVAAADFAWSSSDTTVATVDGEGMATATGSGTVEITAVVDEVPGRAELTVDQEIEGLAFRTEPTDAVAGEPFDPAVRVEVVDVSGHPVADANLSVTVSLAENPTGGSLEGTTTAETVDGVATFPDLWIERAAGGYTLEASAGGAVDPVVSRSFEVSAAELSELVITGQPSDVTAGQAVTPPVEVFLRDAFGNTVAGAEEPVRVEIVDGPAGGAVSGSPEVMPASGVATFHDLRFETAGSGYTLRATSNGVQSDASEPFAVSHASAARLRYRTSPGTTEGQVPFDPPVVVEVLDEFGNLATGASVDVTLSVVDEPGGVNATLQGTTTVVSSDGLATFDRTWLRWPGAGYTLRASSGTREPATSGPFSIHLTFTDVGAGGAHTCGLTAPGYLYCWGANSRGQLGNETTDDARTPVPVSDWGGGSGRLAYRTVEAGTIHTCAESHMGTFCWGANGSAQLGNGRHEDELAPHDVSSSVPLETVSAGRIHSCSVSTDGVAYCWGDNSVGQLGTGASHDSWVPADVASSATFTTVSASHGAHTCGLSTHEEANVFCWGWGAYGQLGDGTSDHDVPNRLTIGLTFTDLSTGQDHTCTATAGGLVVCWGRNDEGQLGHGTTTEWDEARSLVGATGVVFRSVSAGAFHSCALTEGGEAHCWGSNRYGQLGDATRTRRDEFGPVVGGLTFTSMSAGDFHTCGVTSGGEIYCWGHNGNGQLGDGTTMDRDTPTKVID